VTFTPTPEQELILAEAKSPDSLLIEALAGAAKTSTLCLLAAKLPLVPTLCCAFNKRIADEMSKRMPSHIQCSTMNSLGHRAWGQKLGRRLTLATDKVYDAASELMNSLPPEQKRQFGDVFASVMRAVRLAKSSGYVPAKFKTLGKGLISLDTLLDEVLSSQIDCEPDDQFQGWFHTILERGIAESFEGKIDFDDQVYMSALFGGIFPKFPIIMVDEAQDLSNLNHEMIRLMFGGRLIAVGDPYQSIYAFRGANIGSMDLLAKEYNMKRMTLSVSFRCPKAVVERARLRAPHMQYPEWAKDGIVSRLDDWSPADILDGGAIICRNNAPLFTVALRLIRGGRSVKLLGNDIGKSLIAVLKKLGPPDLPRDSVLGAISEWEKDQLSKARDARKASIRDRAECLRVFAEFGETLASAMAYATHLFEMTGKINLMSGHKSKGLEFPITYHLDPFLIPSKFALRLADEGDNGALEQERNLRYVIETRAQEALYLIHTEDMRP
jgi:DNA helicase-2/ATP-dependent DNA helicase PcrA